MSRRLWVPGADKPKAKWICRVPVDKDDPLAICGAQFTEAQQTAFEHHTGKCAREHMDEIRAHSTRGTMFDSNEWDPEVDAHMRKVGKRMKAEGRMTVNPNDKAGFS